MSPITRLPAGRSALTLSLGLWLAIGACADSATEPHAGPDMPVARSQVAGSGGTTVDLGREIYFDKGLSLRMNQSCATCHAPDFGFTGPIPGVNLQGSVYRGSIASRAGNRRPPSAAYAAFSPVLYYDATDEVWVGGNFWDGRATGWILGSPTAEQAIGPFLNPVEQALPDAACVVYRVREAPYGWMYESAWGESLDGIDFPGKMDQLCRSEGITVPLSAEDRQSVTVAYDRIGLSVRDFEGSAEVSPFSSKYDAYLAGEVELTEDEMAGLVLFEGEKAMCSACHPAPLFTDFTYDNLGVPANPLNPFYDVDPGFVDPGLGGFLETIGEDWEPFYGAHKVPTLRNVAKSPGGAYKSFLHNGALVTLEQVVHFYNTRDVLRECGVGEVSPTPAGLLMMGTMPECWPAPEVAVNVNTEELGNLGLTAQEEAQIVAFLKTLSDGWR